ncbi:MAG: alpha-L-arabinofuranosidase C-terminal domain-containing protein [Acidobacteriota bacterium]
MKSSVFHGGSRIPANVLRILLVGLLGSAVSILLVGCARQPGTSTEAEAVRPGVAVLLVDTDRVMGKVEPGIYGHFLEHINHSVVDGLYAEQIQGLGFEGKDFETYWQSFADESGQGSAEVVEGQFPNGEKGVRLDVTSGTVGIRQKRINLEADQNYDGSVWLKPEEGSARVALRVKDSSGAVLAETPLETKGSDWQEVAYSFSCPKNDTQGMVEVTASGSGRVLVDFLSLMRADVRKNGMLRPDLLKALQDLKPPFIRWPGGSFASFYRWKDGIGPRVSRKYRPNELWGNYSDYNGFGVDEFMELCRQLGAEPLICLSATSTKPEEIQNAMDWVHYVNDPPTTEWGRKRAHNGHPEPYHVRYFQIDNEPMNHGLTPDQYAEIVNVFGSRLRKIAPNAQIVACGQKRSNDMEWSEKVIDEAGDNFDILGCHNYEYEPENFETGLRRIQDYLVKLREYVRASAHPGIKIAVLEWSLCRTYDWRAGLHAAGSLMVYEKLSPALDMACPALLMRNTTDDPTWTAFIYHDQASWFPGSGYIVEKLFREHFAEKRFASTTGTSADIEKRSEFFDDISQMKPTQWKPGTVDAIATGSADGKRIVIKAVNYEPNSNVLITRLQGSGVPGNAEVRVYSVEAGLNDACSIENPDRIAPRESSMEYSKDLTINLDPYEVVVVEITAR